MFNDNLGESPILNFNHPKRYRSAESVSLWKTFKGHTQSFSILPFPDRVLFSIFVFHASHQYSYKFLIFIVGNQQKIKCLIGFDWVKVWVNNQFENQLYDGNF